ncbi:hypothetical protein K0M31_019181 [Melipona bicolor]|uniref:Uncharacterized protein n=1 Tax=Melipona bicolor TaxID=60889 RepID=A0AA40G2D2_9HYME|nr:hypothetical protein K0M31_019181 [Melipona bicolor]
MRPRVEEYYNVKILTEEIPARQHVKCKLDNGSPLLALLDKGGQTRTTNEGMEKVHEVTCTKSVHNLDTGGDHRSRTQPRAVHGQSVWFRNIRDRDRFFCTVGATMKRRISRAIVSSMTDRRIDGGLLLARRAIKNALSIVRELYGKLRGGKVIHGKENVDWQNRVVNEIGLTADDDDDELRNSRNENLENELKELTMKTDNRLKA